MPAKNASKNAIGAWSFLIGVVLAVVLGLFQSSLGGMNWIPIVLVLIGLVVGLLNVGVGETNSMLLASTALVIVSFMGSSVLAVIPQLASILAALMPLLVPTAVIVALRAMFVIARD